MSAPAFRMAFREWFGLSPRAAEVLTELFIAQGQSRTSDQLAHAAGVATAALRYHMTLIRAVLDCEGLDHAPGEGYRLTDIGLDECRAALRTVAEELKAAG